MTARAQFVSYAVGEGVASITLDRPPLNAYDQQLHAELQQAWRRAAHDPEARVVVLQATGRHFCAGADTAAGGRDHAAGLAEEHLEPWEELNFVRNLMKPTIAAVQGGCIGGGQRFVFPCDLLFCSDDAFFADPLVEFGIGGIQAPVHAWLYGPRLAKEMLFSGVRVPATRLHAAGSVNRVVPRADLHREVTTFARELATRDPLALRQAKRSVNITTDIMGQHYVASRFAELLDDTPTLRFDRG